MIVAHLPLARALARRYCHAPHELDELVQVASLGLVKAAHRWDPERGVAFATYAVPTIVGEVRRYFRDLTWDVRPPRAVQDLCLAVAKARAALYAELGREPGSADYAQRLGRSPGEIAEALEAARSRTLPSLEAAVADGREAGRDDGGYEQVEERMTFERLTSILGGRAREIVRMRFEDDLLQSEIAVRLDVSPMSVSRVMRTSLDRLAACCRGPRAAIATD